MKQHKEWISLGQNRIQTKKYVKWENKMRKRVAHEFNVNPTGEIRFMFERDPELSKKYTYVTIYVWTTEEKAEPIIWENR